MDQLDKLLTLLTKHRTAHWEAIKYHSKQAAELEKKTGYEIDKIVRELNKSKKTV